MQKLCEKFEQLSVSNKDRTFTLQEIKQVIDGHINEYKSENKKLQEQGKIPMGKYKGKTVAEVVVFDTQYLRWMAKQPFLDNYPELKKEIFKQLQL